MPKAPSPGSPKPRSQQTNPLLEVRGRLEQAENLRRTGKLAKAQKQCEEIIKRYPDYSAARHTLGLVLADKRDYAQALPHLVQASMLNPKDWTTLTALAGVYLRLGAGVVAARTLEQAQQRKPDDANILATLGEIYREEREYELAEQTFRKVLALDDGLRGAAIGLGQSCTHLGQLADAANAFELLTKSGQRSISILYSLSQLPPSLIRTDILSMLDEAVADSNQSEQDFNTSLAFTRAAALDTAGRPDEAWDNLVAANKPLALQYEDERAHEHKIEQAVLTGVKQHPVVGKSVGVGTGNGPVSIFILGPSRSGKTTLENLVGTLDGVKRGYENPLVENSVRQAFQTAALPPRDRVIELPLTLNDLFLEFYSEELEQRAEGAKAFTNTHPGQIHNALRMAGVLPSVRFVFVKRDLDDITLRIFMKQYLSGNAYGYSLETVRDHVTWYYEMIDALAERLPHITTVIQYEEMIAEPRAVLEAVAELCGLAAPSGEWPVLGDDRGCAEPYRRPMGEAMQASQS